MAKIIITVTALTNQAFFLDGGFLVETASEMLGGGGVQSLFDGFRFGRLFVRQLGLACRSFKIFHFLFVSSFFAIDTSYKLSDGKRDNINYLVQQQSATCSQVTHHPKH